MTASLLAMAVGPRGRQRCSNHQTGGTEEGIDDFLASDLFLTFEVHFLCIWGNDCSLLAIVVGPTGMQLCSNHQTEGTEGGINDFLRSEQSKMGVEEQRFVLSLFTPTNGKQRQRKKGRSYLTDTLLQSIGALPKGAVFSVFKKHHNREAVEVYNFLINCDDAIFENATRELKEKLNEGLFMYAFSTALLHRKSAAVLPPSWQIAPRQFFSTSHIAASRRKASTPESDHEPDHDNEHDLFLTGTLRDPEFRLAWFREDVGLNDHHWSWHTVYPHKGVGTPPETKNRQGELFYYMHQQMLARYDAERLAVGLMRVLPLQEPDEPILEGYNPHLTDHYGVGQYSARPAGMVLASDFTNPDEPYTIREHKHYINRLEDAIKLGVFIGKDHFNPTVTIDNLGATVEASISSPNSELYGSVHNMGHDLISLITDPDGRYKQSPGPMGDTLTAVRDPVFFRHHKFVDNLFCQHKSRLPPYTKGDLEFANITVDGILVQTKDESEPNVLKTFMEERLVQVQDALFHDADETDPKELPHAKVEVIVNTASHREFEYKLTVTNNSSKEVVGVFRIFLAPRHDELGEPYEPEAQRRLFIEMDKFAETLPTGTPIEISRASTKSSVVRPRVRTHEDLTEQVKQGNHPPDQSTINFCRCGWPSNLLVPRGTAQGMTFDLFVIVTDWRADRVGNLGLGLGTSYCGSKSSQYPDRRSMGFPFDRRLPKKETDKSTKKSTQKKKKIDIQTLAEDYSNMQATSVKVVFEGKTEAHGYPEVLNY